MKKTTSLLIIAICVLFSAMSCKEVKKKTEESDGGAVNGMTIDTTQIVLEWTAYKTTEKLPVKGTFKNIKVSNIHSGASLQETLDSLDFSIPVSSVFTQDGERDKLIHELFFNVMENTELLSAQLHVIDSTQASLSLKMNDVVHNLPLTYNLDEATNEVHFEGVLMLKEWEALGALESLNKACLELHKGADGVSKTWDEVSLHVSLPLLVK